MKRQLPFDDQSYYGLNICFFISLIFLPSISFIRLLFTAVTYLATYLTTIYGCFQFLNVDWRRSITSKLIESCRSWEVNFGNKADASCQAGSSRHLADGFGRPRTEFNSWRIMNLFLCIYPLVLYRKVIKNNRFKQHSEQKHSFRMIYRCSYEQNGPMQRKTL